MTGVVVATNPARGMVAAEADGGGYSIFEMLGDDPPDIGDRIRWPGDTPLGGEVIENLTQHTACDVFFQNHDVSKSQLRSQLLLK